MSSDMTWDVPCEVEALIVRPRRGMGIAWHRAEAQGLNHRKEDPMPIRRWRELLVVEDEAEMAELLRSRLEAYGYAVQTAATGKAALELATKRLPDLVILDLLLPDMSGYEVCRALRKLAAPWDLLILMLTALDQPAARTRGFGFGADAYLTKPFNPEGLVETVALLLNMKRVRQDDILMPTSGRG